MTASHAIPECVADAPVATLSLSVCPGRLLKVALSAGDTVCVPRGLLWYTIDGRLDDFFVKAGTCATLPEDITLLVTGFGKTDFVLTSTQPNPRFLRRGGIRPYARDRPSKAVLEAARASAQAAGRALGRLMRSPGTASVKLGEWNG
jgi:hypothetical protein